MNFTLKVWRQESPEAAGRFETYPARDIDADASFLEMLDIVNNALELEGRLPIAFDHDCREGICGTCGMMVNGIAHGPLPATTACQLMMRNFKDGDTLTVEPWRAKAFPVIKDLVVDRSALDRIIQVGGFISVNTGSAPEANATPVPKAHADEAMNAAACIGCGACVAACPNASAMLFAAAKISHLGYLPQGQPERGRRAVRIVSQMEAEGFGGCTNIGECSAVCPKEIRLDFISRMNRDLLVAKLKGVR